jgi:hypothetical protein
MDSLQATSCPFLVLSSAVEARSHILARLSFKDNITKNAQCERATSFNCNSVSDFEMTTPVISGVSYSVYLFSTLLTSP